MSSPIVHRPRHAAEDVVPPTAAGTGRHRRPETLADLPRRRPAPAETHFADDTIAAARRAATDLRTARGERPGPRPHRRRAASRRGKHARPATHDPLAITVRPLNEGLTAVRDWALYTDE